MERMKPSIRLTVSRSICVGVGERDLVSRMPSTACCTSSSFANAGIVAAMCMALSRASCWICSSC
eukprot:3294749-Prymnesium_polylepis.1